VHLPIPTRVAGVRDSKNQEWMQAFAQETGVAVLAPDLFRGNPWDEDKFGGDTQSVQYETWRSQHYVAARVLTDIADAALFLRTKSVVPQKTGVPTEGSRDDMPMYASVDQPTFERICAIGFCLGGGRLLEAIATDCNLGQVTTLPCNIAEQHCRALHQCCLVYNCNIALFTSPANKNICMFKSVSLKQLLIIYI